MEHTVAFVGFRHGHVYDVLSRMKSSKGFRIVAWCEEDAATRAALAKEGKVSVTHEDFHEMLRSVEFEVCVVGDWYGKRGSLVIAALAAGKSVLGDKPLCTSLRELHQIEQRVGSAGLALGAMLDLRDAGVFRRMREVVRAGEIGEVCTVTFNGNHPLLWGTRPGWYFEENGQGGTINDLGIHAFDLVPWITGHAFTRVEAARSWATGRADSAFFKDAAQVMGTLANEAGVIGEISYLLPDAIGYGHPDYWRFVVTGTRGVLSAALNEPALTLFAAGQKEPRKIDPLPAASGGYLSAFHRSLERAPRPDDLSTQDVLDASRVSLCFQECADRSRRGFTLPRRA
jgi:predicted dehydrogenase